MAKIVVYDIETIKNFFLYMDIDYRTNEEKIFKIGLSHNELPELYKYLTIEKPQQVGFNNIGFDSQITQYIIANTEYWTKHNYTGIEISAEIYKYTQSVIDKQDSGEWADYPVWNLTCKQLDLFKIWHFNNRAKSTSLKWIQYMIDWENLQDMPIAHGDDITEEQIEDVIKYCRNDVLSTLEFFNITLGRTNLPLYKGKDKILLRKNIKQKFNIDCLNFDDVKIGDELNKKSFMDITGIDKYELKNRKAPTDIFTFGECIPDYIFFKTKELNAFYDKLKDIKIDPSSKNQKFLLPFRGTTYLIAKGGIHSVDKPRLLKPNINQYLRDCDIGSQYPNAFRKRKLYPRHLGEEWLTIYCSNITLRLEAKQQYKKTKDLIYKSIDELYKLALNGGGFGKTGEPTSWQYDSFINMSITIGNQFEILMLVEMFEEAKIHVVSANTDGLVCLFNKDQENDYKRICEEWEIIVGNNIEGKLEYTEYELFAQSNVNNYLAIKKENPEHPESLDDRTKYKGDFLIDFELNKNKSNSIINLALSAYFTKGIDPKSFILEHKNIYDFCSGVRAKSGWHFQSEEIYKGEYREIKQQKTVRYYISKEGVKLIKCHKDGRRTQTEAGIWMQTIFNNYVKKEWDLYDINYEYYISKTYELIHSIQPEVDRLSTQLSMPF